MNKEEQEIIREILASQDKQLNVDVIKELEQNNVKNKKIMRKALKDFFIKKRKNQYPINEENQRRQRQKYTETFRKAVEEEKEKKKEERRLKQKRKKAIDKYNKQEIIEDDKFIKSEEILETRETIFQKVKEVIKGAAKEIWEGNNEIVDNKEKEENRKQVDKRKEFVNGIKLQTVNKNSIEKIIINMKENEKESEHERE